MLCYNVGDSHTCYNVGAGHTSTYPWCPNMEDHYWYKIAKEVYYCNDIINASRPGRSNEAMIKLVMRHCLENPCLPTVYFINITTIFRIDLTEPASSTLHDILRPNAIAILDFETIECTLYSQLIGLMEFLNARNKQFLIFNNSKAFSDARLPKRDKFVEYFKNETRVVNWFENARATFHENLSKVKPVDFDLYQWDGHDGPEGHTAYYKMLLTRLPKVS